jgi:mannose-1-phosphate guanylyltransferase
MINPVNLSGGSGTRLWPLSRELYPKLLLLLDGEHTVLQETVRRLNVLGAAEPLVVCNEPQRFLVVEQIRQLGISPKAIFLEPVGRNTAPAIALAALNVPADVLLLVLPADARGNVACGDVLIEDSDGCCLYAESLLVTVVGLKDHVVVETKDAVMAAPRDRVQDVKKLVAQLECQGSP